MLSNISFDIDGLWSALNYYNIYSDPKNDPFLKNGIPRILRLLKKYEIHTNFFVVGKNVENYPELHKEIRDEHEIGNHTYSHHHNLASLKRGIIKEEIEKGHYVIKKILKTTPIGFRAPTYGISKDALEILESMHYKYDSSFMPAYYPGITPFKSLFLKRRPHKVNDIFEIPISVNPIIPFYLNGTAVIALGLWWLKFSFQLLKKFNLPVIINFHERDAVNLPEILNRQFKRGKKNSLMILEKTVNYLNKHSKLVSMEELTELYGG